MSEIDQIILDLDVAHHKAALMAQAEAIRANLPAWGPEQAMENLRAARRSVQWGKFSLLALDGMAHALQRRGRPPEQERIQTRAQTLVDEATSTGYVLTIEQRPLKPLAMGNYETIVAVRRARGAA